MFSFDYSPAADLQQTVVSAVGFSAARSLIFCAILRVQRGLWRCVPVWRLTIACGLPGGRICRKRGRTFWWRTMPVTWMCFAY